jgi:hypothetical protein
MWVGVGVVFVAPVARPVEQRAREGMMDHVPQRAV